MKKAIWHVNTNQDYAPVKELLNTRCIPHQVSKEDSTVPNHRAIMVEDHQSKEASRIIMQRFGRYSGC